MRVCVVERDEAFNQIQCQELANAGHRVATAYNANAGLHRLGTDVFDALVLGISASHTSGNSITAWIRQVYPELKIIIVPSVPELMLSSARERLSELGADALLLRPFDGAQLIETLQSAVAGMPDAG